MKKFVKNLSAVLAAVLTAGSLLTFGVFASSGATLGDVNGDGNVNNVDASTVLRYDAGIMGLTAQQLMAADANGDRAVNNVDASQILKLDAGIIDGFFSQPGGGTSGDGASLPVVGSAFDNTGGLTAREKQLYDLFVYKIKQGESKFDYGPIDGIDGERAVEILFIAIDNHPEIIWLDWISRYTYNDYTVQVWFWYDEATNTYTGFDSIDFSQVTSAFDYYVNYIVSLAEQKNSDYEKLLFIHDYIAEHTVYNHEAALLNEQDPYGNHPDIVCRSASAYGCLVEGSAICSGYAKAFQVLATRLGFDCGLVSGWGEGGYHAWNYVGLGGDYYFVDATWDDPDDFWQDGCEYVKKYEYFLVDWDTLAKDHTFEFPERTPRCNGGRYSYYSYNGLYLETYSYEAVESIFTRYWNKDTVEIKFGSAEECSKAKIDLLDNGRLADIVETKGYSGDFTYCYVFDSSDPVFIIHCDMLTAA